MKKELSFLTDYLKKEQINIDVDEFAFQAETHPDFPSLYAFSDTLRFFKIENLAAKVSKSNLDDLPERFIALLAPEGGMPFLSLVEKRQDTFHYTENNKEVSATRERFLEIWQEVVLLAERTDDTITSAARSNRTWISAIIFAGIFLFGIVLWHTGASTESVALLLLGFSGAFLAFEVVKKVFGVQSTFAESICRSGATTASGCDTVINSPAMKSLWGVGFSDLSIVFYFGHLISFYLMSISGGFLYFLHYSLIAMALGAPLIFYSLYYQWRIEKKWCTICLLIIGVFSLQLATLVIFTSSATFVLAPSPLAQFLSGFIISGLVWFLSKPRITTYFNLKSVEAKSRRFQRNYGLFRLALMDSKRLDYRTLESPIYLGNPDAGLRLSIVTNLFCGHCALMHDQLEDILNRYRDEIRVNIRFNLALGEEIGDTDLMHFRLLEIYEQNGQEAFMDALGGWFRNKNVGIWFSEYGKGGISDAGVQLFKRQREQNEANELLFTPALIVCENLYPQVYNRADLVYFIAELMDDENFIITNNTPDTIGEIPTL